MKLLQQNIYTKIIPQLGNTQKKTKAIFNLFANSLLDMEESNDDKLLVSITKLHVRLGHDKASKKSIYTLETKSTCSPSPHIQVLSTPNEPSASFESDTIVYFYRQPSKDRASLTK